MTTSEAEPRPHPSWTRAARSPALWAVVLFLAAVIGALLGISLLFAAAEALLLPRSAVIADALRAGLSDPLARILLLAATGVETGIAYADLESLLWRESTDYARIEVQTRTTGISLLVGVARPRRDRAAGLPALSRTVRDRLVEAGLHEQSRSPGGDGRHPGLVRYVRDVSHA